MSSHPRASKDCDADSASELMESPDSSAVESNFGQGGVEPPRSRSPIGAATTGAPQSLGSASSGDPTESCAAASTQHTLEHFRASSGIIPAAQHERLPYPHEIVEDPELVRGSRFLTVVGSAVAALAVLPHLRVPSLPQDGDDWHSPESLTGEQIEAVPDMLDAVASLCVRNDGETHAIALIETSDGCTILHAADASTDHCSKHLRDVWQHLRRHSESNAPAASDDLLVFAYRWCWGALHARFHQRVRDVADGLQKIFSRAFTVDEILQHPQRRRFYSYFSDSEFRLLEETFQRLNELIPLITQRTPDRQTIQTLHDHLNVILVRWVEPMDDKTDNRLGYLLDRILLVPVRSFFEQITWIARACQQVATGARRFQGHFSREVDVLHVKNELSHFMGNLEHYDLLLHLRFAHEDDSPFEAAWLATVPPSLLRQFGLDKQFVQDGEVHCECSLLAYMDAHEPQGRFGYIGLSAPSCLVCANFFAVYNKRGYELASERLTSYVLEKFCSDDDDDDDADDDAIVDETERSFDQDDHQDEGPIESEFAFAPPPWLPIRTRPTDAHVRIPWVAPRVQLDNDGHVSLELLATLIADLGIVWNGGHSGIKSRWDNSSDFDAERARRRMFPTGDAQPVAWERA